MKKSLIKRMSLVLLICMLFGMLGTSCFSSQQVIQEVITDVVTTVEKGEDKIEGPANAQDTSGEVDNGGIEGTYQPPEGEYDIETPEGYNKLTFYWVNPM